MEDMLIANPISPKFFLSISPKFFLLLRIFLWDIIVHDLIISNFKRLIQPPLNFIFTRCQSVPEYIDEKLIIAKEEVNMVIERIGLPYNMEENSDNCVVEKLRVIGEEEILEIFDEEEVSLTDVKEAFDVFDLNKDGFIDATELQRVLCGLGMLKESEMSKCIRMIEVVDENGDGMVDFNEFVKLLQAAFFFFV